MKFTRELAAGLYTLHSCEEGLVRIRPPRGSGEADVGSEWLELHRSCIITPHRLLRDWAPASLDELDAAAFAPLRELGIELLLLGSGTRHGFPRGAALAALVGLGIGYEVMDNAAACRTYNLLAVEGRNVAAALLLCQSKDPA